MKIRIVHLILTLGALLPTLAVAAVPNAPLYWARESFNDDGQAVEHVTISGRNAAGQGLFARFSIANAGFKHGELTVTFRQEASGGTYWGEEKFSKDNYTVAGDRLSLRAGGHSLEVQNGHLVATFAFDSLHATVDVTPQVPSMTVADRRGDFIVRDILAPSTRRTTTGCLTRTSRALPYTRRPTRRRTRSTTARSSCTTWAAALSRWWTTSICRLSAAVARWALWRSARRA
jgi:hypothetical protein